MVIEHLSTENADIRSIAKELHAEIAREKGLAHRSYREVLRHVRRGEVIAGYVNGVLVTFLFATPLSRDVVELHSFLTFPEFRQRGYGVQFLKQLFADQKATYLAVTFHEQMRRMLLALGFREGKLNELPPRARLLFLVHRLKLRRLISVVSFMRKSRPIYLIKTHDAH
jgi:N-acetylglutamate synthase-like GNAT family acetyltransferase